MILVLNIIHISSIISSWTLDIPRRFTMLIFYSGIHKAQNCAFVMKWRGEGKEVMKVFSMFSCSTVVYIKLKIAPL